MKEGTPKQIEILRFISEFHKERSYSPTLKEIGIYFNYTPKGASDHVAALITKNLISKEAGKSRTIMLTKEGKKICLESETQDKSVMKKSK